MEQFPNSHPCCWNGLQHFLYEGSEKQESCCHFIVILGCGSCRTADWSIWHQFTVCMCCSVPVCDIMLFMLFVCVCVYVCQCLCAMWLVPAPAACFLALHAVAHNEPTAINACLAKARAFSPKQTHCRLPASRTTAHTILTERSSLSAAPWPPQTGPRFLHGAHWQQHAC